MKTFLLFLIVSHGEGVATQVWPTRFATKEACERVNTEVAGIGVSWFTKVYTVVGKCVADETALQRVPAGQ